MLAPGEQTLTSLDTSQRIAQEHSIRTSTLGGSFPIRSHAFHCRQKTNTIVYAPCSQRPDEHFTSAAMIVAVNVIMVSAETELVSRNLEPNLLQVSKLEAHSSVYPRGRIKKDARAP